MAGTDLWQPVFVDVDVLRDSCNVYAVKGAHGTLFVNAGTGAWLDAIPDQFRPPFTLLCTHYFRDHAAGVARASRAGMTVFVPRAELEIFADPLRHFGALHNYIVYDNIWENFAPIEPATVRPAHD